MQGCLCSPARGVDGVRLVSFKALERVSCESLGKCPLFGILSPGFIACFLSRSFTGVAVPKKLGWVSAHKKDARAVCFPSSFEKQAFIPCFLKKAGEKLAVHEDLLSCQR